MATATGIELIDLIKEELLKSCELTGIWEKKLRDIERKTYDPAQFIEELKAQINAIVHDVLADNSSRRVTILTEEDLKKKKSTKPKSKKPAQQQQTTVQQQTAQQQPQAASEQQQSPQIVVGAPCPVCGKGTIIKGKTAYGCSRWREGCNFRHPFAQ